NSRRGPVDPELPLRNRMRGPEGGLPESASRLDVEPAFAFDRQQRLADGWLRCQKLARETGRRCERSETQLLRVATGGAAEVERALRERVADHVQHEDVSALQTSKISELARLDAHEDVRSIFSKCLRRPQLDRRGNCVSLLHGQLERRTGRLLPNPSAIYCRSVNRVVLVHRPSQHLSHVPVGVEERQTRDDHISAYSLYFLRVPERKRVAVARSDEDPIRLDRVEQIGG